MTTRAWNMMTSRGGGSGQRTVLITGVSKGIGRALAVELAKRGHSIIGCSRSQDKLDSLRPLLSSSNASDSSHLLLNVDVRSDGSVEELARVVMEQKGVPDMIVNNAGAINRNNNIWQVPADEFDAVIDTNVKGIANVLRHFLPPMVKRKHGIIINISSSWGRSAAPQVAPYCASKWAVEGLTKSVARELPDGMAVVALNPGGGVNTEMLATCFGSSASMYQAPEAWAAKAVPKILSLTGADNGASLTA